MIFIVCISEKDLILDRKLSPDGTPKRKTLYKVIDEKSLELCWLDPDIIRKTDNFFFILDIPLRNLRNIYSHIHTCISMVKEKRRFSSYFRKIPINALEDLDSKMKDVFAISTSPNEDSIFQKELPAEDHCYFISNYSVEYLQKYILQKDPSSIHPLQYSIEKKKFTEITDSQKYLSLLELVLKSKIMKDKSGEFIDQYQSIVEFIDHKTLVKINSVREDAKVFIKGGDNLLVEETIAYLLKRKVNSFFWDFNQGVPVFNRGYEALVFFNIEKLTVSDQSIFWLGIKDNHYYDKLIIITTKDIFFNFSAPKRFVKFELPSLEKIKEEIIRILILLINKKTPKWKLWKVPNCHYALPFNELLNDLPEIFHMDFILNRMNLSLYREQLFSADFWYDFFQIQYKEKEKLNSDKSYQPSRYITPLPVNESNSIAKYGDLYKIQKNDNGYTIDLPHGNSVTIKKSTALDYMYFLVGNSNKFRNSIDVEKLYEELFKKKPKIERTNLLHSIRCNVDYLGKNHPKLKDFNECFKFSETGCFYEERGNIRITIQ